MHLSLSLPLQHLLADVYVAKMSDLGINDIQYHTRSHLGHLLRSGDTVMGSVTSTLCVNFYF